MQKTVESRQRETNEVGAQAILKETRGSEPARDHLDGKQVLFY